MNSEPGAGMQEEQFGTCESEMVWNFFLASEFNKAISEKRWVLPVIHGSLNFKNFTESGNRFSLLLIARRSRHHAGTRFLKRGINAEGRTANFVEVEQIMYRDQPFCNDVAP
jgi:hypothetical protein